MESIISSIISQTKKYVFVRVFKTGSTSVGRMLRNDPDFTLAVRIIRNGESTGHVESSWIKENIFPELGLNWDEYFKFGFVRNPWDREVSNYFFNSGVLSPPEDTSFKEWLNISLRKDGIIHDHNKLQCDYLTDVDYIARFENFEEEVKYIFNKIGVPISQPLIHINKTEYNPYWEYYDDDDIMKVYEWYRKDIEMYNYEFGEG